MRPLIARYPTLRRLARGFLALALAGVTGVQTAEARQFAKVPDEIGGPPASPPVLGPFGDDPPVATVDDWERRRAPLLRAAFAELVYGAMPPDLPSTVLARQPLDARFAGPGVRIEQLTVGFGEGGERGRVNVVLATPAGAPPRALIVMQTFCGNHLALHKRSAAAASLTPPPEMCDGWMKAPARIILGRWIDGPPLEQVLARGYAVAIVYAADLVPDDPGGAGPALERLYGPGFEGPPPGALAAWAWLYAKLGETLTRESGLAETPVVAWGHSRNGKAALLAGAVYPTIAGVIAHQSGRGGAALNRSAAGETIAQITRGYPHWFTPAYAGFAGREADLPIDQHQLIALIAPRPVLLGAGDRDGWADPAGAFRAAKGAAPVWELYGRPAFGQTRLAEDDVAGPLASFMRKGPHGVRTEDWRTFLAFLDAHFPPRTR